MNTPTSPKPRGRPRAYHPEHALEAAMQAFWKGGYSGTSLDALSAAMHINRPSLYAGFGDKQRLYLHAMQRFQAHARQHFAAALASRAGDTSVIAPLTRYLHAAIELYTRGTATGCAVVTTASAEALSEPEIQQLLDGVLQDMDAQLVQYLREAVERGALAQEADIKTLTFALTASVHSIGIRARAGHESKALKRTASALVRSVFPQTVDQAKA